MNWDAISAVAEILGVLAVVASLIYVGRQLGQNTTIMRINAASQQFERDYEIVLPIIESREFAEIWTKGDHEFEGLDEADKQRLLFFERRAISLWHHVYQLRMQNLLPDASWHEQIWIIQNIGRRQAIREAWSLFRGGFEASFQEHIDGNFSIADTNQPEK
jgi:hypothetical protein